MPLAMNGEVFHHLPRSPDRAALKTGAPTCPVHRKRSPRGAIDAAKAGAAVVHCHVRDPETGTPSRRLDYYREVTERIRDAEIDVVLNLTAGMGGDIVFGSPEAPVSAERRNRHDRSLRARGPYRRMPAGDLHA